jgi:hypothetical protein
VSDTTGQPRKRIVIDAPSEMVILAARHLDATEGPVQISRTVDTAARSAITTVLRYIAKAHNAPAVTGEKGVTRRPCRYCPDSLCPEDCPECGSPIHDLDAVPAPANPLDRVHRLEARLWENTDTAEVPVSAVCHSIANDLRIALAGDDHRPTPPDLDTGTRGEYRQWVIETHLGGIPASAWRTPYPEDARKRLAVLRTVHPGLTFRAFREATTRTEEDW